MSELRLKSNLEELLKARELTSMKLAEKAGVTLRAVSALRNNSFQLLSAETTARICNALEISPGELLFIEKVSQ